MAELPAPFARRTPARSRTPRHSCRNSSPLTGHKTLAPFAVSTTIVGIFDPTGGFAFDLVGNCYRTQLPFPILCKCDYPARYDVGLDVHVGQLWRLAAVPRELVELEQENHMQVQGSE